MEGKEKTRLTGLARALPGAARGLESTLSLLEQLGLKPWLAGGMLSGSYALLAWFRDNLPWYMAVLLFLGCLALMLYVWHRVLLIRSTSRWSARKYREVGRDLQDLAQETFRFLAERTRDKAEVHRRNPVADDGRGHSERWEADRDFDAITARVFFERYGTRALGALALLHQIGVTIPHNMVSIASFSPEGMPQFLGTMGDLLAKGYVMDAVDISKDREYMWRLGH